MKSRCTASQQSAQEHAPKQDNLTGTKGQLETASTAAKERQRDQTQQPTKLRPTTERPAVAKVTKEQPITMAGNVPAYLAKASAAATLARVPKYITTIVSQAAEARCEPPAEAAAKKQPTLTEKDTAPANHSQKNKKHLATCIRKCDGDREAGLLFFHERRRNQRKGKREAEATR